MKKTFNELTKSFGWTFDGYTGNGHRKFVWIDDKGVRHLIIAGSDGHSKQNSLNVDRDRFRQRARRCMTGTCSHRRDNA